MHVCNKMGLTDCRSGLLLVSQKKPQTQTSRIMKRLSLAIAAISAVCLTFQTAHASLLFSEGFNYSPGVLGGNINPGNSTAWSAGNSGLTVASGNLTYAGLADLGGNELQIANGSAGTIYNTFANQTAGQVYYSFLFNATAADSANNYFTAMNAGVATPNGGSDEIDAYYYAAGKIELRANALAATAGTGPVLALNTTYLVVEMLDLTAHTASLWVDPDSSTFGGTAPTATATLSGTLATASIDDVGFKAQGAAGGPYLVDNLLIGTTWADVTPVGGVPEPATCALMGLGILGFVTARRQMRH